MTSLFFTWMHWPVLVLHTESIDVDFNVLQQLIDINVATVLRLTAADDPCDGCQILSKDVLFLYGVHWFGEDGVDECSWFSSGYEVGMHKVRGEFI